MAHLAICLIPASSQQAARSTRICEIRLLLDPIMHYTVDWDCYG